MAGITPLVGYVVQLEDCSFMGYDRHGEDVILHVEYGDTFMCHWWNAVEAQKVADKHNGVVRVDIDGRLV